MNNPMPCANWAEKLAQKPEDLSPTDREMLQAHLATCPACAQTLNDYQMLIGRLRALPRPAPRPMPQFVLEALDLQADQESAPAHNGANNAHAQPGHAGSIILLPPLAHRQRAWQRRLSGLVAAVVLLALVGTLALLFLQHGQSAGGIFQIRPGWQQIALYSGTGNKTITGQHLQLPPIWGSAFTCTGSGGVDIRATGPRYIDDFGADDCNAEPPSKVVPDIMNFDLTSHGELQTFTVKADAGTRWSLQFLEKVPQPAFVLGPGWVTGMGGGGNGSGLLVEGPVETATGQLIQAQTWGVVFVCIGSGKGKIQFIEQGSTAHIGEGGINTPTCDGQPRIVAIHYAFATILKGFYVRMTDGTLWHAAEIACTNESQCQSTPSAINVTPTPTTPPNAPPRA